MGIVVTISLDAFCIVINTLLIGCLFASADKMEKLSRLFLLVLVLNSLTLLCDMLGWIADRKAYAYDMAFIYSANFLVYFFAYLMVAAFSTYLIHYIYDSLAIRMGKPLCYLIYSICLLAVISLIISQFTQTYYYFDENHYFHKGSLFWVAYLWSGIMILVNIAIILRHRKKLGNSDSMVLLSYHLAPLMAQLVQVYVPNINLLYVATTISALLVYLRIHVEQSRRLKEKELELLTARIDIMLSQIQPHFLYNTLQTIKTLCLQNGQQAAELVQDFSEYLRDNMDSLRQRELVPFDREWKHVQTYLKIEKMRFEERLNVVTCFETTDFCLPILTVLPIVENAVHHGITKKQQGGTIQIATHSVAEEIKIVISDDGAGFDPNEIKQDGRSHMGIENVKNRLAVQCGGMLTITSREGAGTSVAITIPQKRSVQT